MHSVSKVSVSISENVNVYALSSPVGSRSVVAMNHKLETLVVCRFEKLSMTVQYVLRTASIVGSTFSRHVLFGAIPNNFKKELTQCLETLLEQKWIIQDTDDASMYEFFHLYAHKVIYNLTPSSERKTICQTIADYLEETCAGDPSQYAELSYRFHPCNLNKSLQYAVKAAHYILDRQAAFELSECVELLTNAVDCCTTVYDVEVLMSVANEAKEKVDGYKSTTRRKSKRLPRLGRRDAEQPAYLGLFGLGGCCSSAAVDESAAASPVSKLMYSVQEDHDVEDNFAQETSDSSVTARTQAKNIFSSRLIELHADLELKESDIEEGGSLGEIKDWQLPYAKLN